MDREGGPVGTLERLILHAQTGQIGYGMVSLSQEDRLVAIPWTVFKMNRQTGQPTLALGREEVTRYLRSEDTRSLSSRLQDIMAELEHGRATRLRPPRSMEPPDRPFGMPRDSRPGLRVTGQPAASRDNSPTSGTGGGTSIGAPKIWAGAAVRLAMVLPAPPRIMGQAMNVDCHREFLEGGCDSLMTTEHYDGRQSPRLASVWRHAKCSGRRQRLLAPHLRRR